MAIQTRSVSQTPPSLAVLAPPQTPWTVPSWELSIPLPEYYTGEVGACSRFLLQCTLVFDQQPSAYTVDKAKLAYAINLLRGKAGEWVHLLWEVNSPALKFLETFSTKMLPVFDQLFQSDVIT